MFRFLLKLISVTWLALICAALFQMLRTPEWLKGRERVMLVNAKSPAPKLIERMEDALYKKSAVLELQEAEVNQYLQNQVTFLPNNAFNRRNPLWLHEINLLNHAFELRFGFHNFSRHLTGFRIRFSFHQMDKHYLLEPEEVELGRMRLPKGFMAPLLPFLRHFSTSLKPEIDLIMKMSEVKLEKNKILLDPRLPTAP